ncbi:Protein of unknown function [Gryllus bimaculatus]|nr:Protein of unknown function [Gryllus bimaculatus]
MFAESERHAARDRRARRRHRQSSDARPRGAAATLPDAGTPATPPPPAVPEPNEVCRRRREENGLCRWAGAEERPGDEALPAPAPPTTRPRRPRPLAPAAAAIARARARPRRPRSATARQAGQEGQKESENASGGIESLRVSHFEKLLEATEPCSDKKDRLENCCDHKHLS